MNTRELATEYRLSHWARIMQDRKDSGLSVRAYCKKEGFHENRYFYWQKRLREATCEQLAINQVGSTEMTGPTFAEVRLSAQAAYQPAAAIDQNQVCVEASGMRVTAGSGYPADSLAYLLRAVTQPC